MMDDNDDDDDDNGDDDDDDNDDYDDDDNDDDDGNDSNCYHFNRTFYGWNKICNNHIPCVLLHVRGYTVCMYHAEKIGTHRSSTPFQCLHENFSVWPEQRPFCVEFQTSCTVHHASLVATVYGHWGTWQTIPVV